MKTECIQNEFKFQGFEPKKRIIKKDSQGESSDGGLVLLMLLEKKYRIISRFSHCFKDLRNPERIIHPLQRLLKQRIYGLCQGYEDVNDHEQWRDDPFDLFMETYTGGQLGPQQIIIDVDATDDPIHGNQEGRFFNGYYDEYCYLPLYMFVDDFPLWAELRTADIDPATGVIPALEIIIGRIRKRWPWTRIILRGDSGFNRPDILSWCEKQFRVYYILGLPKNKRLLRIIGKEQNNVRKACKESGTAERAFTEFTYQTKKSWEQPRRVIAKAEQLPGRANPRFIVTSLDDPHLTPQYLYEGLYCARGDMENRIKEQKLFMYADRLSTQTIRGNQLRLWFSTIAYIFMVLLRKQSYRDDVFSKAQASSLRVKLLKVAARVEISLRRIVIHISSSYPYWNAWFTLQMRLQT